MFHLEGNIGNEILPRLKAADADMENIRFMIPTPDQPLGNGAELVRALGLAIESYREYFDLIAIDPLACVAKNINNADEAREVFGALNRLAERTKNSDDEKAAVLVVSHAAKYGKAKKTMTDNLSDMTAGSVQQQATARGNWVIENGENPDTGEPCRVMLNAGGNADWPDENRPPDEYIILTDCKTKHMDGLSVHARCVTEFQPTSGAAKAVMDRARGQPTSNEIESEILDCLSAKDWTKLSDIVAATGRPRTTIMYRLNRMEQSQKVQAREGTGQPGKPAKEYRLLNASAYAKG